MKRAATSLTIRPVAIGLLSASLFLTSGCKEADTETRSPLASTSYVFDTGLGEGNAEIPACVPGQRMVLLTNSQKRSLSFIDIIDLENIVRKRTDLDLSRFGEPTSVTVHPTGRYAIVAISAGRSTAGKLIVVDLRTQSLGKIIGDAVVIGVVPDCVQFNKEGTLVAVAIEAEKDGEEDKFPGAVELLQFSADATLVKLKTISLAASSHKGFEGQQENSIEPEYLAFSSGDKLLYVTCQENNKIVVIDVDRMAISDVWDAGIAENKAITDPEQPNKLQRFNGRREPDGIAMHPDGEHLITANEGDTKKTEDGVFSGARSITVWNSAGVPVGSSADQFVNFALQKKIFPAKQADKRGVEPESVAAFEMDGKDWAAVTLEKAKAVALVDVTNPNDPKTIDLIEVGKAPEGLDICISDRIVAVGCEGDGTLHIIKLQKTK